VKRLGVPTVRLATRQAMRLLGSHFVLGQTIEEALSRAGSHREFRYSFDYAGRGGAHGCRRGALSRGLCRRHCRHRCTGGKRRPAGAAGISVKLSALHPRYEAVSRERVLA
jgi:RHH-type proline utilization regulon transcriptional repressor/proline dehydrogenase/delta 1-pyrroline-5-carboxylate dehydrogenase